MPPRLQISLVINTFPSCIDPLQLRHHLRYHFVSHHCCPCLQHFSFQFCYSQLCKKELESSLQSISGGVSTTSLGYLFVRLNHRIRTVQVQCFGLSSLYQEMPHAWFGFRASTPEIEDHVMMQKSKDLWGLVQGNQSRAQVNFFNVLDCNFVVIPWF